MDTGGLSRAFWRLFVNDIVDQYCIGEPGSCLFVNDTVDQYCIGEPGSCLFVKNVQALQVLL